MSDAVSTWASGVGRMASSLAPDGTPKPVPDTNDPVQVVTEMQQCADTAAEQLDGRQPATAAQIGSTLSELGTMLHAAGFTLEEAIADLTRPRDDLQDLADRLHKSGQRCCEDALPFIRRNPAGVTRLEAWAAVAEAGRVLKALRAQLLPAAARP